MQKSKEEDEKEKHDILYNNDGLKEKENNNQKLHDDYEELKNKNLTNESQIKLLNEENKMLHSSNDELEKKCNDYKFENASISQQLQQLTNELSIVKQQNYEMCNNNGNEENNKNNENNENNIINQLNEYKQQNEQLNKKLMEDFTMFENKFENVNKEKDDALQSLSLKNDEYEELLSSYEECKK